MWFLLFGCHSLGKVYFGTDSPTDLSGVVNPTLPHPSCTDDSEIIQETPQTGDFQRYYRQGFTRYAFIVAPNGGVIPIFAQDGVSDLQLRRARSILSFYLTDSPGTLWGSDKGDVANNMAANGASLMMPNGAHEEGNEPNLPSQPLYAFETPVAGDAWFMESDYEHRDAALEEIFHLVHDTGIGTYLPGVRADYQSDLDSEARMAIEDGRWGIAIYPEVTDWLNELEREESLAQEYIAAVIDSYYGLWGAWTEDSGGMWGIYIAKTRAEMTEMDPSGKRLLEQFLPAYYTGEVRLAPDLDQHFSLSFDSDVPYTHQSQYFVNVTLTGAHSINITGNAQDNTLRGNSADNIVDGLDGEDVFVLCQPRTEYSLEFDLEQVIVSGPNGEDILRSIEHIHFEDGSLSVEQLRREY